MTISHNRITEPTTMANAEADAALAPIPQSPTGLAIIPQVLIKIGLVLVALATVVISLPAMGIPLPPAVIAAATAVVGLGAALGIGSQGVRKVDAPK